MGNKIRMTKGDTFRGGIAIVMADGNKYEPKNGDRLNITVRKPFGGTVIIQKELGPDEFYNGLVIHPSETANVKVGFYEYDAQLTLANGDVVTVIKPTPFEICRDATS